MEETEEKERLCSSVRKLLQADLLAADMLVSLLWAAASTLRHDSLLRPFPSTIPSHDGHRDITQLRSLLRSLHSLDQVLERLSSLSSPALQLLEWTLSPRLFSFHYIPTAELEEEFTAQMLQPRPDFVFRLQYRPEQEARFRQLATPHGTFLAFHGSQVECFHSILHCGLLGMFNKTSAFGEGTYLSTDLGVSLNWSPSGSLWPCSTLPHTVSCVAVCEVIRHPAVMSRRQSGGEPSLQHSVPERYFVVTNDEMVRVVYLLLFSRRQQRPHPPGWLRRHWFVLSVVLYLLFLVLLGILQSRQGRLLWARLRTWGD